MNKLGLIGYGSMGSMLIEGFLASDVLTQAQVSRDEKRLRAMHVGSYRRLLSQKHSSSEVQACSSQVTTY